MLLTLYDIVKIENFITKISPDFLKKYFLHKHIEIENNVD